MRGRPVKKARSDEDRHAVALMEALRMTGQRRDDGTVVRLKPWAAAQRAEIARAFTVEGCKRFECAPPTEVAEGAKQRRRPTNPAFKRGYSEIEFTATFVRGNLRSGADRLRKKLKAWEERGGEDAEWVKWMAYAWIAALYPKEFRQQVKCARR